MLVHSAPEQCWQLSRGGYGVSQSSEEVSSLLVITSEGIGIVTVEGCHGTAGLVQHLLYA